MYKTLGVKKLKFYPPGTKSYIEPRDEIKGYIGKLQSVGIKSLPSDLIYTPIAFKFFEDFLDSHIRFELPPLYPNTNFFLLKSNILFFSGLPTAPATCMLLEELIALGIKKLVFVGLAGGLKDIEIGDRLIVYEAIRLEGTSFHYFPNKDPAKPSKDLITKLYNYYQENEIKIHTGKICTTDAPFRETYELISQLQEEGVVAIEMEISAVYSVAQFRNIEAVAVVIISDELKNEQWSKFQRNIFSDVFKHASLEAIKFLSSLKSIEGA